MIGILDYKVGNLKNVKTAVKKLGYEAVISDKKNVLEKTDGLILPGVGAFRDSIEMLDRSGLHDFLDKWVSQNRFLLGICLGMQLLFDKSYEMGTHRGLMYIPGEVVKFSREKKIPHMGWNELFFKKSDPLINNINEGDYVYFVHSYYVSADNPSCIAYTNYGENAAAIVKKNNIYGAQFHPEKSADTGLQILKNYLDIVQNAKE